MRATRPMDWAEFEKTVEWARLSIRQKMWVRTYVDSGKKNQVLATICAYETSSGENARLFSYKVVRQKKIQAALNRYWNKGPRELVLEDLQRDIAAAKPKSAVKRKLQAIFARIQLGGKLPKRGARK